MIDKTNLSIEQYEKLHLNWGIHMKYLQSVAILYQSK